VNYPAVRRTGLPNSSGIANKNFVAQGKSDIPSKGRSPGSQDPNLSLATCTY
jgi:hypothetical protein